MIHRILSLAVLAASLATLIGAAPALAQSPAPLRLVVPFATGGPTDIAARVIAPLLGNVMQRPVVVENKVGATGAIGTEFVARAAPDGNTVLFGTSSILAAAPAVSLRLPYDPMRDFVPVGLVATIENVLVVHPSVPVSTVAELVAYAKANPGKLSYGSSGMGSTYHLGSEWFKTLTGAPIAHVPYKGAGPAAQDLLAGHIQVMFDAYNSAVPNLKAGRVKALGIASAQRSPELPLLPTIAEQGVPGYRTTIWIGFFLPAKTPRVLVDRMHADLARVMAAPEVRERFAVLGMQPATMSPDELGRYLQAEIAQWAKVVKDAGIKPE